jgi:hypothetical protein
VRDMIDVCRCIEFFCRVACGFEEGPTLFLRKKEWICGTAGKRSDSDCDSDCNSDASMQVASNDNRSSELNCKVVEKID